MNVNRGKVTGWGLLLLLLAQCENKSPTLKITTVKVDSLSQIVLIDSLVKPITYTHISGLDKEPVPRAKQLFISAILPSILIVKRQLEEERIKLIRLEEKRKWTTQDSTYYLDIKRRYKASNLDNLLMRMETIPNSIVIAQAALESGWGQSRFFLKGNNIFGMWSYNKDEPRIKAGLAREDKTIHVRAYADLSQSIRDYFETLGTARAYKGLRKALQKTQDPFELIPHLKYYSESRAEYVERLRKMITINNLTQYDSYQIDPQYLVEE